MLWVTQIEQTQAGFSYAGMPVGDRVVRWELRDEQVLLRDVKYAIRADVKDSVKMAVEATSIAPIIKTFPVKAWGKDKAAVIDVTSLFTGRCDGVQSAARAQRIGDRHRTDVPRGDQGVPQQHRDQGAGDVSAGRWRIRGGHDTFAVSRGHRAKAGRVAIRRSRPSRCCCITA